MSHSHPYRGAMKRMTYEAWVKKFKPIKNPFDDNTSVDGYLFQPYGDQWAFVAKQNPDHVWTLIITDLGRRTIWSIAKGFHIVNREGYVITGMPHDRDTPYDIRY